MGRPETHSSTVAKRLRTRMSTHTRLAPMPVDQALLVVDVVCVSVLVRL